MPFCPKTLEKILYWYYCCDCEFTNDSCRYYQDKLEKEDER